MLRDQLHDAIDQIQTKVIAIKDNTKDSRARKGAYVDCLIILKKIVEGKA